MKKFIISSVFAVMMMVLAVIHVSALTLDNIGVTSSADQTFTTWSYLGTNPRLMGTADPNETVTISIDGTAYTTTADADGDWAYTPTTLNTSGDYEISIASGTETIAFTLTINSGTATASSSTTTTTTTTTATTSDSLSYPDTLPQSGVIDSTLFLVGGGMFLIMVGVLFYWKIIPALLLVDPAEDLRE